MIAVDVGAHVGYYTVLCADLVGPRGKVYAVEPAEQNLELLRDNVARFTVGVVTILPCAAGRDDATRKFHVTDASDTHGFYDHPLQNTVRIDQVPVRRLDGLIHERADLVKIDVEGAELEVLAGAEGLLERPGRLTLVLEWNPACLRRAGRDPAELLDHLASLGFAVTLFDEFAGHVRPIAEVSSLLARGALPEWWFANLVAERW